MRYIFVLALCLVINHAQAQPFEGSIFFNDGTAIKGRLIYNQLTGIVTFESQSNIARYNARNLAGFEFDQRQFYSIPYLSQSGVVKQFFEVIKEYTDFAVVARTSALSPRTNTEMTTFYFLQASDQSVTPYLEILDREVKWHLFDANKTQVRILNSSLPEEIMGEYFSKVKAFAKERKLVWHVKDSLLSILDYYDSLLRDPVIRTVTTRQD